MSTGTKSYAGLQAASALAALRDEGIDPAPYFETVAHTLLRRHGRDAVSLAAMALRRMRAAGDNEGQELWQEVSNLIRIGVAPMLADAGNTVH